MLDQVYNAINILKPFGTCLILLLSSYFPVFTDIHLFLPWPMLSYQISPFKSATAGSVAGSRHTGVK